MWLPGAISKNCQTQKNKCGIPSHIFQYNWPTQAREAEATSQGPMVVIPTLQTEASFTFKQPATVPAVSTQPSVTMSDQTQNSPGYCVTCTPVRKQCPTKYLMPLKSDWSDSEKEEKDTIEQNAEEEKVEDWDGDLKNKKH